jgi:hypothetical protein
MILEGSPWKYCIRETTSPLEHVPTVTVAVIIIIIAVVMLFFFLSP